MDFLEQLYTLWGALIQIGEYATYQTQYYEEIFPTIVWLLALGIGIPLIYYLVLNGKLIGSSSFGTTSVWAIIFILTLLVVGLWTGYIAISQTEQTEIDAYIIYLSILNAFFALLIYLLFSVILKPFSTHARNTPF